MAEPIKATVVGAKEGLSLMNKLKISYIVVAFIVVWALFSAIRVIDTGRVGVVTQYGKVTGRELDEGLNLVMPFGINEVAVYDIKVQKEQIDTSAATKDLQDVTSSLALNYRLNRGDVSKVHQTIGVDFNDKVIAPALSEVFKSVSAKYNAGELITNRADLKKEAFERIRDRLKKYGIVVEDLSLTNFQFSASFSQAIEDKQVAQQNAERAKFNLEAAKTDAEAQKAQSETLSDAYLKKQAIEKWDGKLPTYMGGGSVFNIPLQ